MSSVAFGFVHAISKRAKKCLAQTVVRFGSLGPIPTIQVPLDSSWAALQFEPGTKFFHRAVPELRVVKNYISTRKYWVQRILYTNNNSLCLKPFVGNTKHSNYKAHSRVFFKLSWQLLLFKTSILHWGPAVGKRKNWSMLFTMRTHARMHTRTHARMHTHTHTLAHDPL